MRTKTQSYLSITAVAIFGSFVFFLCVGNSSLESTVLAQVVAAPTPMSADFDQKAAIAKLREQIKGKEQEPSSTVFRNIQMLKTVPAGRLLGIMEFGYARSLGVDCTHCHVPDKWDSEEKPQKQIARDMSTMSAKINGDLLKSIKNLKSDVPTINCTTCHRGEVKPALNLSTAPKG